MELKIANKNYTLHFGWSFLEEVNKEFGMKVETGGQEINTRTAGLPFLTSGLESYDPIALAKGIKAAVNTEVNPPSFVNIKKYVEELIVNDTKAYQEVVKDFLTNVKNEPMLKALQNLNK